MRIYKFHDNNHQEKQCPKLSSEDAKKISRKQQILEGTILKFAQFPVFELSKYLKYYRNINDLDTKGSSDG